MERKALSTAVILALGGAIASIGWSATHRPPLDLVPEREEFRPVDTSKLMGSPDPIPPLTVESAFPNLAKFTRPICIGQTPVGDRMFVVGQEGQIVTFPRKPDVSQGDVRLLLDVQKEVLRDDHEEGLLGMAFHPKFAENGKFYIFYSKSPRGSAIVEYCTKADDRFTADPKSKRVILEFPKPFGNHNGGSLLFGNDGRLYIAVGDGGSPNDEQGNGQNLGVLLAKILRIDVDAKDPGKEYAIPADNPFVNTKGARGEIWAYGVRNPWRMSLDKPTGEIWIGDVGQELWEEVDVVVKGGNYGWSIREGKHPFGPKGVGPRPDLIEPIVEYPHTDGRSITGGCVYRGKKLPELAGMYLYCDFVAGTMWGLKREGKKGVTVQELSAAPIAEITAFGTDQDGEVYFSTFDGRILQFKRHRWHAEDAQPFPTKLSETGLFTSMVDLTPAQGVLPYDVNVPLFSDGAEKERYVALPQTGAVKFSENGRWEFPVGTVFVKHFYLPGGGGAASSRRRIETRLLIHHLWGWDGYTYRWNESQTDAELLDDVARVEYPVGTPENPHSQTWTFPSRSDCRACHTRVEKFVLGASTRQMNRVGPDGKENQLELWDRIGLFADALPKPPDKLPAFPDWKAAATQACDEPTKRPIEMGTPEQAAERARAYLDVHCAVCHQPQGTGYTRIDLRHATPLKSMGLVNEDAERPRPGHSKVKLVTPGKPMDSELLQWIHAKNERTMPPLGRTMVDDDAAAVLARWIADMKAEPAKSP
jgi:uncharacterized repeat protein (TIGR03806 family)